MRTPEQDSYSPPKFDSAVACDKICQLLKLTYESSSTEQIRQAERELESLAKSSGFLDNLLRIIAANQCQGNVRKAAATFSMRYVQIVLEANQSAAINIMTEKLLTGLYELGIPMCYRRDLLLSMNIILAKDTKNKFRAAYTHNLINLLQKTLQEPPNYTGYYKCITLATVMLGFCRYDTMYQQLLIKSFGMLCTLGVNMLVYRQQPQWFQITLEFTRLILLCLGREDIAKNKAYQQIVNSILLRKWSYEMLAVTTLNSNSFKLPPRKTDQMHSCLIHIVIIFNNAKLHRHNVSMALEFEDAQLLMRMAEGFINQAIDWVHSAQGENQAVKSMVAFLLALLPFHCFYDFYQKQQEKIVKGIILPILCLSEEEKKQFIEQPEVAILHYNNFIDNHTVKGEISSLRNAVSQLVIGLANHLDGWLPTIFHTVTDKLIAGELPMRQRQVWIMMISIMFTPSRNHLGDVQLVKNYLLKYLPNIMTKTANIDQMVQAVLIFSLASRYMILISNIQFTIDCTKLALQVIFDLQCRQRNPCLSVVAIQVLYMGTISIKIMQPSLYQQLITSIARLTHNSNVSVRLLDIIHELFEEERIRRMVLGTFESQFDDDDDQYDSQDEEENMAAGKLSVEVYQRLAVSVVGTLCQAIVLRINQEHPNRSIIVSKCWNIVREIVCMEIKEVSTDPFVNACMDAVLSLYDYVGYTDLDFDDDAVDLSVWLMKRTKSVYRQEFLPMFYKVLVKNKNIFSLRVLEAVLVFFKYSKQQVAQSQEALQTYFTMSHDSLFVKVVEKVGECSPCQGLFVLQTILIELSGMIPPAMLSTILNFLIDRLKNNQFIKFTFFKANLVATIAICLVHAPSLNSEEAKAVLSEIARQATCVDTNYPLKIYVSCMVRLTQRVVSEGTMEGMANMLFKTLLRLLMASYVRQSQSGQEEGQLTLPAEQQEEYRQSLNLVQHNLVSLNEYHTFRELVQWLSTSQSPHAIGLLKDVTSEQLEFIKKTTRIQRIQSSVREILRIKRS